MIRLLVLLANARVTLHYHRSYVCETAREERFHRSQATIAARQALALRAEVRALRAIGTDAAHARALADDQAIDDAREDRAAS